MGCNILYTIAHEKSSAAFGKGNRAETACPRGPDADQDLEGGQGLLLPPVRQEGEARLEVRPGRRAGRVPRGDGELPPVHGGGGQLCRGTLRRDGGGNQEGGEGAQTGKGLEVRITILAARCVGVREAITAERLKAGRTRDRP